MHFLPVTENTRSAAAWPGDETLTKEYRAAHAVGVFRVGSDHLFFRAGLKYYAIPCAAVTRFFRRVQQVPAKMCCGQGNFQIESLVLCGRANSADGPETELAQIQLPGVKAARLLMEELQEKLPHAAFGVAPPEPEKAHHARHNKSGAKQPADSAGGQGGRA